MRAIGFYQYLPVEDPDSLVEVEVPTPEPGGRDLLVRVKAVSVNPVDTKVRARQEGVLTEPRIPGWDAAGVVAAVGKDMARDARYFRLATRICAELGAHYVKTYYIDEGFETVTASCPVPIVMAGGKKIPEFDALTMAYNAVQQGASGVDMGRNIFQSENPVAMIQAVKAVVHENETPEKAYDLYNTLKQEQ